MFLAMRIKDKKLNGIAAALLTERGEKVYRLTKAAAAWMSRGRGLCWGFVSGKSRRFAKLKQFRRGAPRYEKLKETFSVRFVERSVLSG